MDLRHLKEDFRLRTFGSEAPSVARSLETLPAGDLSTPPHVQPDTHRLIIHVDVDRLDLHAHVVMLKTHKVPC